ncbi:MAG: helix-turn-helix transcriptional regulator [Bacteroidetes bacterium]|nr:helix-turn-helix transcriptional regulator [Bacteroidota bacterium]
MVDIGKRAKALREAAGLSRQDLEAKVSFSAKTLENVERGANTTIEVLIQLAAALGTTVAYLIGESDEPTPSRSAGSSKSGFSIEEIIAVADEVSSYPFFADIDYEQAMKMGMKEADIEDVIRKTYADVWKLMFRRRLEELQAK